MSKNKQKLKTDKKKPAYIQDGYLAIEQLGIKLKQNDEQDQKWLTLILGKYLRCGSWTRAKQHRLATSVTKVDIMRKEEYEKILHSEAKDSDGQMNYVDIHQSFSGNYPQTNGHQNKEKLQQLQQQLQQQKRQNQIKEEQKKVPSKRCRCCGQLISQQISDFSTEIGRIENLGICNLLYFQTIIMIGLIFLCTVMILCFYSFFTNIVASAIYRNYFGDSQLANSDNTFKGLLMTSFGSKSNIGGNYSHITIIIQCWLTFITICFMGLLLFIFKQIQIQNENFFSRDCKSSGKFSIFLADVPIHLYGKDKQFFQSLFQQYVQDVKRVMRSEGSENQFQAAFGRFDQKIQVQNVTHIMPTLLKAFYKQRKKAFKQLQEEKSNIRKKMIKIIKYRKKNGHFRESRQQLEKQEAQINDLWKRQTNQRYSFMDEIKQMDTEKQRSRFKTLSVVVTFNNSNNKQLILALHARQQSLMYKLFYRHFTQRQFLMLPDESGHRTEIKTLPAPQPEDIIWENHTVTHPYRIAMIILMHLTTVLLLAISFIVVYFLSGQSQIISNSYEYKKSFWIVSLVITIFLQAFDFLIGYSIKKFTKCQRHCSQTDVQTSIAAKTIMGVLVNSTLIPACIYGLIKRNVFGVQGLADTIFLQSIIKVATAIFMPLIWYAWHQLKICWKKLTCNLLKVKQRQLNTYFEKPEFQIGTDYAQLVGLYYFGCFYCNLQPLVAIIVGFGIVILYYSKKIAVYRFQKRPVQGSSQISHAIDNFIYLGPIVFAIGNFLWTDTFSSHSNLMFRIPNILTLLVSFVIFFAPFQEFNEVRELKRHRQNQSQQKYKDQRIFFSSQYARKNPLTQNEAIQQHQEYLRNYFRELQQRYISTNKLDSKNEQEKQAKRNLQNQLQKLQDQFDKQNKFGYTDEQYVQDNEQYDDDQPCIIVDINNSNPKVLMVVFNFLNRFENELQMHDKFKTIPVYANVGDWENDLAINYHNLQYLGLQDNDIQQIDQIVQKIFQNQDMKQIRPQSYFARQNDYEPQYNHRINGSDHQYPPELSPGTLRIQRYQNPQLSNIPKVSSSYQQYSRYSQPAQYSNNLQQDSHFRNIRNSSIISSIPNIPNMPIMANPGHQQNIATTGMHHANTGPFTNRGISNGSNQQNPQVGVNTTSPNYMR